MFLKQKLARIVAPFFDSSFYLSQFGGESLPDDPVAHFLEIGWRSGFDPSPDFSVAGYLDEHPDVVEEDINPLLHYVQTGKKEGRATRPSAIVETQNSQAMSSARSLFDEAFYRQQISREETGPDAFDHYLVEGAARGLDPCEGFSTTAYREDHADVAANGINPLMHYVLSGRDEGRQVRPSAFVRKAEDSQIAAPYFDSAFYRRQAPDLADAVDPLTHFLDEGWRAGFDPSPGFSTMRYLEAYTDVAVTGQNPFMHWLVYGRDEGREAFESLLLEQDRQAEHDALHDSLIGHFDPEFYRSQALDLPDSCDLLEHYLEEGWRRGLDPSPFFSTQKYLDAYPDVRASGVCPLRHWVLSGQAEGRLMEPSQAYIDSQAKAEADTRRELFALHFDAAFYRAQCEADPGETGALQHFLNTGWRLGLDPTPGFSVSAYLETYPDVAEAALNPFVHWLTRGRDEARKAQLSSRAVIDIRPAAVRHRNSLLLQFLPSVAGIELVSDLDEQINLLYYQIFVRYSLFDVPYYRENYLNEEEENTDAVSHYILKGAQLGFKPNAYFDPSEYIALNPDVLPLGLDPLVHYFLYGNSERRPVGRLFDGEFYKSRYEDVTAQNMNPLQHFLEFGRHEGRAPHPSIALDTSALECNFGARSSGVLLLVAHDCEVGGAQQLLRDLGAWLLASTKYDVKFVAMGDGAHRHLFEKIAPLYVIDAGSTGDARRGLIEFATNDVCGVFLNSVASANFFEYWPEDTPAIAYIHELEKVLDLYPGALAKIESRCVSLIGGSQPVVDNLLKSSNLPPDRVELIHNFIGPIEAFLPQPCDRETARRKLKIDGDAFVVMGCGVLHWRKSPEKFIEVAKRVLRRAGRPCRFVWIGGGPDEQACRNQIAAEGLEQHIDLIGYQDDVSAVLNAADLFLLPSVEDPFPLVCLLAAAKEIPVICFREAGGIPELVAHGCGKAVAFGNVESMTRATLTYLNDAKLCERHGKAGLAAVRAHYTVKTAGPAILNLMRNAMGAPPHISVIVPNYNYMRYLDERLSSIVEQTFQDFEIILLDDASTDGSDKLLERWEKRRPGTRYLKNERNSGSPFRQWIKGMREAQSDLVWIAEADDYCEPDLLEGLLAQMDDRNIFLGHVKSAPVNSEGDLLGDYDDLYLNRIAEGRWRNSYVATDHEEVDAGFAVGNVIPNASAVLVRRFEPEPEFLERVSSMRMCGDWYFYLRAARGGKVAFNKRVLNYHRRHGETVTHQTEGSLSYFEELAEIRRYAGQTWRLSDSTKTKAAGFTVGDLDRFGVSDPEERAAIEESSALTGDKAKLSLMVVVSDLSPGGGQMFAIRLANAWMAAGGRAFLLNVGKFPDHEQVLPKVDSRVVLLDARSEAFSFSRAIAEYDIDIVHTSMWWSDRYVAERLAELPDETVWVLTTHGCYETLVANPKVDGSLPTLFPRMVDRVDHWVYTADKNLGVFDKFERPQNLSKVDNGFEPRRPVPWSRSKLGLRDGSLVVLLASRAIKEKGWFEAVAAVERLNADGLNVDLMLIGEGPVADDMRAKGTPEFVHIYGQVSNLEDYIAVCDVGLLPSYFEGESMPLVLIEFMAQGKPIIASDVGEIPDMMTDNDGQVAGRIIKRTKVGKISISGLVRAIMAYCPDTNRRAPAEVSLQVFKARFTMTAMINSYSELYRASAEARQLKIKHGSSVRFDPRP